MRGLDSTALQDFEGVVRREVPKFEVAFKDESKLMSLLGFLSYPFNPSFMTTYTTTWGTKVYFPSKAFYTGDPGKSFRILAHEFVHLWDSKQHPATFKLSYLFPQLLAVLPLLAYAVLAWPHAWIVLLPFVSYALACVGARWSKVLFWVVLPLLLGGTGVLAWWFTGWWGLTLLGTLLFLVPWPAYWRTKWEIRGYGMNVATMWWLYSKFSDEQVESIVRQFTGPGYFFMSWSGSKIRTAMAELRGLLESGELEKVVLPYAQVHDFLQGE
jgi:hypothetical protein